MIVAVTGGTGFIGKRLLERLIARGDTVRVLSRRPALPGTATHLEVYELDLLTAGVDELARVLQGVDVLFHCAGQLKHERAMKSLHVDATRKLIGAAAGRIGHWVQLSSVGVYGPKAVGTVDEGSALAPRGEYETTKTESDLLVLSAAEKGDFSCTILRPSNVYGAGMTNRSLYSLIGMVGRGWFFFIGKPGAAANYIHVDNVADALLLCATKPQAIGQTYNLSDQRTLEQFIAVIAAALGRTMPRLRLPEWPVRMLSRSIGRLPGFPLTEARVDALTGRAAYPTKKIEQELGYTHRVSMEEGLRELVGDWLKANEGNRP